MGILRREWLIVAGVALAAARHGVPAVIVMPVDAPRVKIENTKSYGAEVVLYDRVSEDRDAIGAALAKARGLTLIRPYDEPEVIAGQATVGLEIAAQARRDGVRSLRQSGLHKVKTGMTSLEEVLAVTNE